MRKDAEANRLGSASAHGLMVHTSGAGERAARLGLRYQDRASAVLAYQAILDGTLTFVALADDHVGMFDDLVIGIAGKVVGHQYKSSGKPRPIGVRGLLLGSEMVIADALDPSSSWKMNFPGSLYNCVISLRAPPRLPIAVSLAWPGATLTTSLRRRRAILTDHLPIGARASGNRSSRSSFRLRA